MISSSNTTFLGAQIFDQIGGLLERHIAIVIALNQQQGSASSRCSRLAMI